MDTPKIATLKTFRILSALDYFLGMLFSYHD